MDEHDFREELRHRLEEYAREHDIAPTQVEEIMEIMGEVMSENGLAP